MAPNYEGKKNQLATNATASKLHTVVSASESVIPGLTDWRKSAYLGFSKTTANFCSKIIFASTANPILSKHNESSLQIGYPNFGEGAWGTALSTRPGLTRRYWYGCLPKLLLPQPLQVVTRSFTILAF